MTSCWTTAALFLYRLSIDAFMRQWQRRWDRDYIACKAWNLYHSALYRRSLLNNFTERILCILRTNVPKLMSSLSRVLEETEVSFQGSLYWERTFHSLTLIFYMRQRLDIQNSINSQILLEVITHAYTVNLVPFGFLLPWLFTSVFKVSFLVYLFARRRVVI